MFVGGAISWIMKKQTSTEVEYVAVALAAKERLVHQTYFNRTTCNKIVAYKIVL